MVMKLHTGVPGSGKSYLLVKSFTDAFCVYNKDFGTWEIKPQGKLFRLISNIEGLTIPHESLDVLISDWCRSLARSQVLVEFKKVYDGDADSFGHFLDDAVQVRYLELLEEKVRWFFNDEYQKSLADGCTLVYLIEECQRYFDTTELGRKAWVRDVLYFFERHRHYGISFFMDTQHISKIHRGISVLFEEEIQAKPRTLSVTGEFRYNSICDGLKTNQFPIVVRPDKRIFAAYQSRTSTEAVKTRSPVRRLFLGLAFCACLVYVLFLYARHTMSPSSAVAADVPKTEKSIAAEVPKTEKSIVAEDSKLASVAAIKKSSPSGWVRMSYVLKADGTLWVIHPETNAISILSDLGLRTKIVGTELYALCP